MKNGIVVENISEAKETAIDIAKRVVKNKQHEKGLDMQTANLIVQIYDAVNPQNKKKMEKMPIKKLANVVWKIAGK